VGVQLFERRHKALGLTEEGQAYYRTVAQALEQLRDATRSSARPARPCPHGDDHGVFAALWLVPRLARFRAEHPHVDVRIAATHEVLDLDREGIDVSIRDCSLANVPPGAEHLVGEHLAAVCSPAYAKQAKATKVPLRHPEDLRTTSS